MGLNSSSTNITVPHACKKITQRPAWMPVSPGVPITSGSSGTKDKDGCEDDIAQEEEKHCWATLLTTMYI